MQFKYLEKHLKTKQISLWHLETQSQLFKAPIAFICMRIFLFTVKFPAALSPLL